MLKNFYGFDELFDIAFDEIDVIRNKLNEYKPRTFNMVNKKIKR